MENGLKKIPLYINSINDHWQKVTGLKALE
jgi:hypothetical protein